MTVIGASSVISPVVFNAIGALVVLSAAAGPILSWLAAKKRKRMVKAVLVAVALTTTFAVIGDTCWTWEWLCLAF